MKGLTRILACLLVLVAFYDAANAGGDLVLCRQADGGARVEVAWQQADCRQASRCDQEQQLPPARESFGDPQPVHASIELLQGVNLSAPRADLLPPVFPMLPALLDALMVEQDASPRCHPLVATRASDPMRCTRAAIDSVILLI